MRNANFLLTFIEVVERGSFSKAADYLSLSAMAVSKQIQSVEKEVGQNLLAVKKSI